MSRLYRIVLTYPDGRRVVIRDAVPSDVADSVYDMFRDSAEVSVVWSSVRVETTAGYLVEEFRAPYVVKA